MIPADRLIELAEEGYVGGRYGVATLEALIDEAHGRPRRLRLRTTRLVLEVARALCSASGGSWWQLDAAGRQRWEQLAEEAVTAVELHGKVLEG